MVRRWPGWIALAALASTWRLVLAARYAGWEESDYGNLAMVRGVLESGFRRFDMNHLPLYYAVSAAVMAITGDAVLAARAVSHLAGVATVLLAVLLARRLHGVQAAWLAAPVLVFQAELALYAASSLREPLYAALVVGSVLLACSDRLRSASALAGLAFLTRMDALPILAPPLLLQAASRRRGIRPRRVVAALLPLLLAVLAWAAYCRAVHGTWAFWAHSVQANLETGGAREASGLLDRLPSGLRVVAALLVETLPRHLGAGVVLLAGLGILRAPWRRADPRRTAALATLTMLGFWLGIGFLAQHEPGHNLYWKWLHAVVPLLVVSASGAAAELARRWRPRWMGLGLAVALLPGWGLLTAARETRRQLAISEALYAPQLRLARWIEAHVPEGSSLLVDNIPGSWIRRRPGAWRLWTWMDLPAHPGDPGDFERFLLEERVEWVLWFREDWTGAPAVAPFLGRAREVRLPGGTRLVEQDREDGYGWVFYRVEPPRPVDGVGGSGLPGSGRQGE